MHIAYYRTDTGHDAVFSLVSAADFLGHVRNEPYYWRWFVLALHSALQGMLTLSLTNTNAVLVQKPGVARRMLEAFDGKGEFPEPYMDNFLSLYNKAKNPENLPAGSIALPCSDKHSKGMASVDELRDEFIHFNSKSWSIEIALLVQASTACCEVLHHLLTTSNSIRWYELSLPTTALQALESIQTGLVRWS